MKNDVYLRAAKLMDEGFHLGPICAIRKAATGNAFFCAHEATVFAVLFSGGLYQISEESDKEVIILALLFMHWMSQDE